MPLEIKIIHVLTLISVFSQILRINCQEPYCDVDECISGTDCIYKAKTTVTLGCSYSYKITASWIRTIDNLTISENSLSTFDIQLYTIQKKCKEPKPILYVIKSLGWKDEGQGSHLIKDVDDGDEVCKYNLYIYDDIVYGFLRIENNTYQINQTTPISSKIDSFKQSFEYDFNIEHLPLDSLIANGTPIQNAKPCDENSTAYSWLKCLQSNIIETKLQTCQDNLSLSLSYSFNKDKYKNITAKTFDHLINFNYPPKVKFEKKDEFYNESNETLKFTCEYLCGNPTIFTFEWFDSNGNQLSVPSSDNKFEYKGEKNDSFVIYCQISNGINYTNPSYVNESRTYFNIVKKPINPIDITTTESSTASNLNSTLSSNQTTVIDPVPSGLKDWEIAVIVVNCVLALVIIGGLLFYILVFRRRSKEKEDLNQTNIYDNTPANSNPTNIYTNTNSNINEKLGDPVISVSARQIDLDNQLIENPLYDQKIDDIERQESESSENIRRNSQTLV